MDHTFDEAVAKPACVCACRQVHVWDGVHGSLCVMGSALLNALLPLNGMPTA